MTLRKSLFIFSALLSFALLPSTYAQIPGELIPIIKVLQMIDSRSADIQKGTDNIQLGIDEIKQIIEERQKLIVAVGQLDMLAQFGKVVSQDIDKKKLADGMQQLLQNKQSNSLLDSITENFSGLSYDGKKFNGSNADFVQDIVGYLGEPLALDEALPQVILPVSTQASQGLSRLKKQFQRDSDNASSLCQATAAFLGGGGAKSAVNNLMQDGVFLRKACNLDSAFTNRVVRGSGPMRTAFYAAVQAGNQFAYDPLIGNTAQNGSTEAPFNLDNVFSNGAFDAIAKYLNQQGSIRSIFNTYFGYARTLAPVLEKELGNVEPGKRLVVTKNLLDQARSLTPLFSFSTQAHSPWRFAANNLEEAPKANKVVVLTPTLNEAQEFKTWMKASTGSLSRISVHLAKAKTMLAYTQEANTSAIELKEELEKLSKSMTQRNAIESIPLMIQNLDAVILSLHRQEADYFMEMNRLKQERHLELEKRADYVKKTRNKIAEQAPERMTQLLLRLR